VMAHLAACHMQDAASGHSQAVQGLRH